MLECMNVNKTKIGTFLLHTGNNVVTAQCLRTSAQFRICGQSNYLRTLLRPNRHTHTHPFNGLLSGTTQVSRYQKGKTNLDFTEERDSEWQWHQLGHMQVCISLQTDNHASTTPLSFFSGRMPFLSPNQQRQSTEGNLLNRHVAWISYRFIKRTRLLLIVTAETSDDPVSPRSRQMSGTGHVTTWPGRGWPAARTGARRSAHAPRLGRSWPAGSRCVGRRWKRAPPPAVASRR